MTLDVDAQLGDPFTMGDPTVGWAEANAAQDPEPVLLPEDWHDDDQGVSPDAPYGINPNTGKPYKMSPEQRAEVGKRLADARAARASSGRAPSRKRAGSSRGRQAAPRPQKAAEPDYRPAVAGLLGLVAFPLQVGARFSPTLGLDGIALHLHTPYIAEAVHQVALEETRVAAVLDRLMQVGPYGALFTAVTPLIMQILCNHGILRPSEAIGTYDAEQLLAQVEPLGE